MRFPSILLKFILFFDLSLMLAKGSAYDYSLQRVADDELSANSPGCLSFSDFILDLKKRGEDKSKEINKIEAVRVSTGLITDPSFEKLMTEIKDFSFLPDLKILDISNNRISSAALIKNKTSISDVFKIHSFLILDIHNNPAAGIESESFFKEIDEETLKRIIWIQEEHLDQLGWANVLKARFEGIDAPEKRSLIRTIKTAHSKYFSALPKYKNNFSLEIKKDETKNPLIIDNWENYLLGLKSKSLDVNQLEILMDFAINGETNAEKNINRLQIGKLLYEQELYTDAAKVFTTVAGSKEDDDASIKVKGESHYYLSLMHKYGKHFNVNIDAAESEFDKACSLGITRGW